MSKASLSAHAAVGLLLMVAALYSWTYENSGLLGSTKFMWAPALWLLSIIVLLTLPLHYDLRK